MSLADGAGMKRAAIIITALIAATQMLPAAANVDDSEPIRIVRQGASDSRITTVAWAFERFEIAGLALPSLDVFVHDTKVGCDDHDGLYTPGAGPGRIDICTDAAFIILHELGHAWEYNSAADSARKGLMEELDLVAWSGDSIPYRQRGQEVAANLIAWGLVERSLTPAEVRTNADRLARFVAFTGATSPRIIQ